MKVAIMFMSVPKDASGQPMDWRKYLADCKRWGLEGVDLFVRVLQGINMTTAGMKQVLKDMGLKASIYCVPTDLVSPDPNVRKQSLDMIRHGIASCQELGIKQLFSHGGQHNNKGPEALARYVDGLSQAAEMCAAVGITLSIENAGTLCGTMEELHQCVMSVKPSLSVTLDTGNFVLAGSEPHKATELLAPKTVHVHVKNFISVPGKTPRPFEYCPLDDPNAIVKYARVRDILAARGYDGYLSFEPEGQGKAPTEGSLRFISKLVRKEV
jgi:sugar phosphate isomerase/epimerase